MPEETTPQQLSELPIGARYQVIGIAQHALREAGVMDPEHYVATLLTTELDHPAINAARLAVQEIMGQPMAPEV